MADRKQSMNRRVRHPRKCRIKSNYFVKDDEFRTRTKRIAEILKQQEVERSAEDVSLLKQSPDIVQLVKKKATIQKNRKERILETEDPPDILQSKCEILANAIKNSKDVVVYTGAGISTAASIPDYRGPNGVWTLLKQGKELNAQDLSDAEPTLTHMAITKLYRLGHVRYVVSQNCDGLHMRSGYPRCALSEVHGNMYIERCHSCRPHKEYIRLFDVTEKTAMRRHKTERKCLKCGGELQDTIVHFGERSASKVPYRWKEAVKAANSADIILCLGSSLKVLRKYSCLWCMNKRPQQRPKLYVVNLQWTPKDDTASVKINGRCDDVMKRVTDYLGITVPPYNRNTDPIFRYATSLTPEEHFTKTKKMLEMPPDLQIKLNQKIKPDPLLNCEDSDETRAAVTELTQAFSVVSPLVLPAGGSFLLSESGSNTLGSSSTIPVWNLSGFPKVAVDLLLPTEQLTAPFSSYCTQQIYPAGLEMCCPAACPLQHIDLSNSCSAMFDKSVIRMLQEHSYCRFQPRVAALRHLEYGNKRIFEMPNVNSNSFSRTNFSLDGRLLQDETGSSAISPGQLPECTLKLADGADLSDLSNLATVSVPNYIKPNYTDSVKKEEDDSAEDQLKQEDNYAEEEDRSNEPKRIKRRSSSSVPGWFGKGLVKRKRKF